MSRCHKWRKINKSFASKCLTRATNDTNRPFLMAIHSDAIMNIISRFSVHARTGKHHRGRLHYNYALLHVHIIQCMQLVCALGSSSLVIGLAAPKN